MHRGPLIILLCFIAQVHLATTYYVSPGGNDGNSGTSPAMAFETIQHAADVVVAGDSVIVLSGSYTGFYVSTSGTSGAPIVFLAEPNVFIVAPTTTTDGINVEGVDWIEINGFIVNDQPRNGIRLVNAHNCIVRNCSCDNNAERGIFTGFTDDILIEYNTCSNSIDEHGIYVSNSSDRSIIRYNTCYGNNRGGIQINADLSQGGDGIATDPELYGNILYSNGLAGGAAINLDGVQGAFIYNNLLYDNHATGIALFQQDGGGPSINATIIHNTIIQASDGRWCILLVNGASGATIHNNILINLHPWRGSIAADPDGTPGLVSDYNLVINSLSAEGDGTWIPLVDWQALGYDLNSSLADPLNDLFIDHGAGDFHLVPGCQAVDAANSALAAGVDEDLEGTPRPFGPEHDNGAYEETSIVLAIGEEKEANKTHESTIDRFDFSIRPGTWTMAGPLEQTHIRVLTLDGRLIHAERPGQSPIERSTRHLIPGAYILTVLREGRLLFATVFVVH